MQIYLTVLYKILTSIHLVSITRWLLYQVSYGLGKHHVGLYVALPVWVRLRYISRFRDISRGTSLNRLFFNKT